MGATVLNNNQKPKSLYERMCSTCLSAVAGVMLFVISFVIQFIFHTSVKAMSEDIGKARNEEWKHAAKHTGDIMTV